MNHTAAGKSVRSGGTAPRASCSAGICIGRMSGGISAGGRLDRSGRRAVDSVVGRVSTSGKYLASEFSSRTITGCHAGYRGPPSVHESQLGRSSYLSATRSGTRLSSSLRRNRYSSETLSARDATASLSSYLRCVGRRRPEMAVPALRLASSPLTSNGSFASKAKPTVSPTPLYSKSSSVVARAGRPASPPLQERRDHPLPPDHVADQHRDVEQCGLARTVRPGYDVVPVQVDDQLWEAPIVMRFYFGNHRFWPGSSYFVRNALYAFAISGRSLSMALTMRVTATSRSRPRTGMARVST